MPFVNAEHRFSPDMEVPGDRTYFEYKHIMERWCAEPRWSTIDALAKRIEPDPHDRAFLLAFLVFFATHGMDYELKKRTENGDL